MNRLEFMSELEKRLAPLSREDREDALNYYEELFDEAGPIDEQKIINDLDSPADIARQILVDNGIAPDGTPEYMVDRNINNGAARQNTTHKQGGFFDGMDEKTKIIVIVALIIITSPLWGGILSGVAGLVFGFLGVLFGLVCAFSVGGVALSVAGIVYLFKAPPIGLVILGISFIILALDILIIFPLLKWGIDLLVKLFRWVIDTLKGLVNKKNSAA